MPFTVTHPLGRPPIFAELQALARQHEVQLNGNEQAGDFCHPDPEHPKVKGNYAFEPDGVLRGDFTSHVIGKITGSYVCTAGKAEVTITEKPFLVPEGILKAKLSEALQEFCAQFQQGNNRLCVPTCEGVRLVATDNAPATATHRNGDECGRSRRPHRLACLLRL